MNDTTETMPAGVAGTHNTMANKSLTDYAPDGTVITGKGANFTDKYGASFGYKGWGAIRQMVDEPQPGIDKSKAEWCIPSSLKSRSFKEQEQHGRYWLLWADFDENPKPVAEVAYALKTIIHEGDFEVYSTRGATAEKPKSRALIPLEKSLGFEQWNLCQEVLNDKFSVLGFQCDPVSTRAAQLC